MVPTWIFIKPNGELLEDNGVEPDVHVPPGADTLEAAVKALRRQLR
jgi:C-terminal processing protease CtpA/Prc